MVRKPKLQMVDSKEDALNMDAGVVDSGSAVQELQPGEQGDLIPEYTPEFKRKLGRMGRAYRKIVKQRVALLADEVDLKEKIKAEMHEAGHTKVVLDGMTIELKPSDEKVKVTVQDDDDDDDDDDADSDT